MAKFYNNKTKTGKLAGSVFAVRYGETIERAYQPIVANPSTPLQVASRAKLKILSQLAAVMAPVIAMRRVGAVSKRNLFTKVNYGATLFSNNAADINLTSVKLTKSVVAISDIAASREGSVLSVQLVGNAALDVNRVVYACFIRDANNEIRFAGSAVISDAGELNTYPTTISGIAPTVTAVVYAYGVRDNTEAARTAFGNIMVPSAEMVANLVTSSQLLENDVTLTETKAVIVPVAG